MDGAAAKPADFAVEGVWRLVVDAATSAGIGIVIHEHRASGRTVPVLVNDVVLHLIGVSREEYLESDGMTFVASEDRPLAVEMRRRRERGETVPSSYRLRAVAKDGRHVPIEVGVARATIEGKAFTVAYVRDLTAGHAAEARLVNLETIYGATIDGLLFVDRDRNLVSANRRFAEIFGLTLEEVTTLPKDEVRRRARERYRDPSLFDAGLDVYGDGDRAREYDGEFELVGEPRRVIHEHSMPIFDAGGEYVGRVWTFRDVTRERDLARELEARTEELERHAERLGVEVERRSEKLAQAAKMAALGQLVAGVAHEVNNPLAFVKSNTELVLESLREVAANEDVRAWAAGDDARAAAASAWLRESRNLDLLRELPDILEMNLKGVNRIREIVRRLREFASPRPARLVPTDLDALARDTALLFRAQFGDRLHLVEDLGAPPPVACDPGKIGQVLTNLLVNAAQAIEGRGTVTVTTRAEGGCVLVRVADTGKGIPVEHLPRIFDPFFTTKEAAGLGLGLSISYGIVKEHGGDIGVEVGRDGGTIFSVRLPLQGRG